MDLKKSFSFTFTIPPFKKVYWNTKRRQYANLSMSQQYHFLEDIMMKIIHPLRYNHIDWVYEQHEDKRLHIHGYCILEEPYFEEVYLLRDSFYSLNQKIGIKMSSYLKLSDIQETRADLNYWIEYINKHQDNIMFKNGYTQQKELTQSLDCGVVSSIYSNVKLPNWCDEPDNDKYRFKGKNKFIVEI